VPRLGPPSHKDGRSLERALRRLMFLGRNGASPHLTLLNQPRFWEVSSPSFSAAARPWLFAFVDDELQQLKPSGARAGGKYNLRLQPSNADLSVVKR
jgi:hypothetical protein